MNHIFISYSRKDEKIVDSVANVLRAAGLTVWQDKSGAGTGIPFSTKWFDIIKEALYLSGAAIIFRSQYWEQSVPCANEFELIRKCDLPYIELDPAEVAADQNAALQKVAEFYRQQVNTDENNRRTTLYSAAYMYRAKMNPRQLLPHTKGLFGTVLYMVSELSAMKKQIRSRHYDELDPELAGYMHKYLRYAGYTALRRAAIAVLAMIAVVASITFVRAFIEAYEEGGKKNELSYAGQAVSGQISGMSGADAVKAIETAVNMPQEYLSVNSYFSLTEHAALLKEARLPVKVLQPGSEGYDEIAAAEAVNSSARWQAELSGDTGSVILTDTESGMSRTMNLPVVPELTAWNSDGTRLICAGGSRVYICDPYGSGQTVPLAENYEHVTDVKFVEQDDTEYAAAVTERGTVLLWEEPLAARTAFRSGINYGCFRTGAAGPEAVYADGRDIVIRGMDSERVITLDIEDEIPSQYFDLSTDGRYFAFVHGGSMQIAVVDLDSGTPVYDLTSEWPVTALAWSADGSRLYASSAGCGWVIMEMSDGTLTYGSEGMYTYNVCRVGDRILLTSSYGYAIIYDADMKSGTGLDVLNQTFTPVFAFAADEERGYIYTVNRGAGAGYGCARYDVNNKKKNLFVVPEMDQVDANTAAAVSPDGAYGAFGYPNGTVRIYEQEHMYLVSSIRCAGERISAMQFAQDGSRLYLLGSSGSLYECGFTPRAESSDIEAMRGNWAAETAQLKEKRDRYIAGIED